ncbi:Chitin deacetylase 2 [Yarrowia sp. C11]|nr:Chitin deacetylase 2 [Yarrowia sp. E02]KAG5371319.1 Chitin deacetylase 2 [Yarrowia sp. C11]
MNWRALILFVLPAATQANFTVEDLLQHKDNEWWAPCSAQSGTLDTQQSIMAAEPFPPWLASFTGLTAWPQDNPPYIPLDYVDLATVPNHIAKRELGVCDGVERTACSFDCHLCIAYDDIRTCNKISQTFDDGPSPSTPKLLEMLPSKTTFFVQGVNVVRFPEIFREQHRQGHLLASHTWSHPNLASLSNEEIVAQLQWTNWAMNATAGIIPRYFRPPYGSIDNRVRAIVRMLGMQSVLWDRDTFDWKVNAGIKTSPEVVEEVEEWKRQGGGWGLILEHDTTIKTVNVGLDVAKALGPNQLTVAECVGQTQWYQDPARLGNQPRRGRRAA